MKTAAKPPSSLKKTDPRISANSKPSQIEQSSKKSESKLGMAAEVESATMQINKNLDLPGVDDKTHLEHPVDLSDTNQMRQQQDQTPMSHIDQVDGDMSMAE